MERVLAEFAAYPQERNLVASASGNLAAVGERGLLGVTSIPGF